MDLPLEKDVVFQIAGVVEWYFEVLRRVAVGDVPDFTSTVDHRPLGLAGASSTIAAALQGATCTLGC